MKKWIIFLAFVLAMTSCSKMKCDFYFSDGGGTFKREMEIDSETLKIQSGDECSGAVLVSQENTDDEHYQTGLDWVDAFYYSKQHYVIVFLNENTTGHERYFTVSGSLNGKETSYSFRQKK